MPESRKRAFIVMDLDSYEGDASDLAIWVEAALGRRVADVTVYATLDDVLHDKALGLDMFAREEAPIAVPQGD